MTFSNQNFYPAKKFQLHPWVVLEEMVCTTVPKLPINQLQSDYKNNQKVVRAYCPSLYTVVYTLQSRQQTHSHLLKCRCKISTLQPDFKDYKQFFFNLLFCEVSSVHFFLYERRTGLDFVPLCWNHFMYDLLFANYLFERFSSKTVIFSSNFSLLSYYISSHQLNYNTMGTNPQ